MYVITGCERGEHRGWSAILPQGARHEGNFAGISHGDCWRGGYELCRISYCKPEQIAPPVEVVPDALKRLLWASEQYPPALALARDAVRGGREEALPRAEFIERLSEQLKHHLDAQPTAPYFLARCVAVGDIYEGCYFWIVGWHERKGERHAVWVSDDCWAYDAPVTDFDVSEEQMLSRFGAPRLHTWRRG